MQYSACAEWSALQSGDLRLVEEEEEEEEDESKASEALDSPTGTIARICDHYKRLFNADID